jgi:hypothetical protein
MTETVDVPKALLERLLDRVDDLEAELKSYRATNEHDKATIRQDVNEAIEQASSEPAHETSTEPENDSPTPMEQIIQAGEESVAATVTASVRRAKQLAMHFGRWSTRTPNGLVIKNGLKDLLETATGERLRWVQIYRACEVLEKFTKGAIRFETHSRHGKMLIADRDNADLRSLLAVGG